jgi:serine/threonine protein kinase
LQIVVPLPQQEVRVLGRYALYDEIAAGGMATVHIGRLLGPVGFSRTVAIKRLHAQYAKDPEFVSMFLDEARLAARIRHPNVIGTLDVVALSGELFLVMEYVPGDSFAKLWRSAREAGKPIPLSIVSAILVGLLEGLHAAHEATNDRGEPLGIVHRDVSPHNVIVGTDGIARVLDFGVAKAAGRLQTTREGQLKGKISYMAPEQVQGTVDRTTDIYAASVVLWEALTGKRLFFAENEARTLANVLYPRVEQPSRHARGIPGKLDAVVLRGLDPNPAGRFQTAREMARALQTAMPPAASYDVGEWVQATAGATVVMRARRVASIERSTTTDSDFRPMQVPSTPVRVSELGLRAPIANDAGPGSDLATVTAPSHPPMYDAPRRRSWLPVAIALVLVAGFAALATRAISLQGMTSGTAGAPTSGPIPVATSHATATATVLTPPAPPSVAAAPTDTSTAISAPAAPTASTRSAPSATGPVPAKPVPHPPVVAAPKRGDVEFEHVLDSRK